MGMTHSFEVDEHGHMLSVTEETPESRGFRPKKKQQQPKSEKKVRMNVEMLSVSCASHFDGVDLALFRCAHARHARAEPRGRAGGHVASGRPRGV